MPGQVFGGEVEANLIQLRGEHVRMKSGTTKKRSMKEKEVGTTKKRSMKEKEVAEALTAYLRQLGEMESVFTASVVHSKINNVENEGNKKYRKRRQLVVLLQVGDPSEDRNKLRPLTVNLQTNFNHQRDSAHCQPS